MRRSPWSVGPWNALEARPRWGDTTTRAGAAIEVRYADDVLEASSDGDDPAPLLWQGADEFKGYLGMPSTVRFVRDEVGSVEALDLVDIGPQRFERVGDGSRSSDEG